MLGCIEADLISSYYYNNHNSFEFCKICTSCFQFGLSSVFFGEEIKRAPGERKLAHAKTWRRVLILTNPRFENT